MSAMIVPMDRIALSVLVANERDPLTAELASGTGFVERAMVAASRGHAHVLLADGFPVIGMGLLHHWAGLAEAWALISKEARPRHIVEAVRAANHFLDLRQRDPAFGRIEMFCRADRAWVKNFAAALGFEREGLLRRRDPAGRNHLIFGRVREVF